MESSIFKTVTELSKQYNILRDDILKRHGYKHGDKVRLKNAIMLYQKFGSHWTKTTSIKNDMIDRIKMNDIYNVKTEYKLITLV